MWEAKQRKLAYFQRIAYAIDIYSTVSVYTYVHRLSIINMYWCVLMCRSAGVRKIRDVQQILSWLSRNQWCDHFVWHVLIPLSVHYSEDLFAFNIFSITVFMHIDDWSSFTWDYTFCMPLSQPVYKIVSACMMHGTKWSLNYSCSLSCLF